MARQKISDLTGEQIVEFLPPKYKDYRLVSEACEAGGYAHEGYVSQMGRTGVVPSVVVEIGGRKRRLIDVPALLRHKERAASSEAFGGRGDVSRWVLRIKTNMVSVETVQALLTDNLPPDSYIMEKPKYYGKSKSDDEDEGWSVKLVESLVPDGDDNDDTDDDASEDDFLE